MFFRIGIVVLPPQLCNIYDGIRGCRFTTPGNQFLFLRVGFQAYLASCDTFFGTSRISQRVGGLFGLLCAVVGTVLRRCKVHVV